MKVFFEKELRQKYYSYLEKMFDSNFLSEGEFILKFEEDFARYTSAANALAVSSGGAALLGILEYANVKGAEVIVPTNTFMATPLAVVWAGGKVVFADVNKNDLCLSVEDLEEKITPKTKAVVVVHIGGHIAFDILKIKELCEKKNIILLEDCAHAHGASLNGVNAGNFGVAGAYSFYATKTMPLGEGGMVISNDKKVIDFVKKFRNYGKFEYKIKAYNFRMNEITAAFGLVQLERLPKILEWKNSLAEKYDKIFKNRLVLPQGMKSGYYKYIVFEKKIKMETGKVYADLCHDIMGVKGEFPNAEWVKDNHVCPPIYYGWEHADLSEEKLKSLLL